MVKKTYNQPTCLVVALGTCHMMAESIVINSTGETIQNDYDILTKENKDVNLWDEEW